MKQRFAGFRADDTDAFAALIVDAYVQHNPPGMCSSRRPK
jgi:hypothetical protein